ncbi:MAG: M23 family metallopeptidase, partial [Pseudoflavonifractor sp.]
DELLQRDKSEHLQTPVAPMTERIRRAAAVAADGLELAHRKLTGLFHRIDAVSTGHKVLGSVAFLLAAAAIGSALVVTTVYTPAYVVAVDGVTVGTVREQAVFEQAEARVEARVSGILGYDYSLDHEITYEFGLSKKDDISPVAGFDTYLFNQVGEVMKSYVLMVNGQLIGAATDQTKITAMLDALKAPYLTEHTVEADFVEAVSVKGEYTPRDIPQDLNAMQAALTANTSGQTTYEIQKGDTFMAIAYANDMSMEELQDLNPEVNINRIYIGQILKIKEVVPFLSVRTVDALTYEEAIPCPVEEVPDDTMYKGNSKVLATGEEGLSQVTANVTYVNGHERERNVTESQVLSQATTRVVAVGTKPRPKTMPNGYFVWPLYGNVTSNFGYRYVFGSYSYHSGLDIAAPYGSPIAASDGGTVVFAGTGSGSNWSYGKYVLIDHGNGKTTRYAHCSKLLVSAGDKVYQGQTIAKVGSTGRSTGNHCHFMIEINGTAVNPRSYLN